MKVTDGEFAVSELQKTETCLRRNGYFERRRGDSALSPKEQETVLSILKAAGVTEEMKFDSYEENINWYD